MIIKGTLAPSGSWAPFLFWLLLEGAILSLLGFIVSLFNVSWNVIIPALIVGFVISFSMAFFQHIVVEGGERKDNEYWVKFRETIQNEIKKIK